MNATNEKDKSAKIIFLFCAGVAVLAVLGIIGYILYGAIPAFRQIGLFNFLFGMVWAPGLVENGVSPQEVFGILPMIVNTLFVTVGAIALGGTVGVFTAIFLVFWCPNRLNLKYRGQNRFLTKTVALLNKINLKTIFDQVIRLLAGIPSIIYGFFGMMVLVPFLAKTNSAYIGEGVLACSIILAVMVLPTVTSLSKNALEAVPDSYFEGALALGNSKAQAVFNVVLPAARSGIISAVILGVGRAVGETMAVIMVAGNKAAFPNGLFSYIRTLTTNIVMEMSYAELSLHRPALIATGFVLLVIVLIINVSINFIPKEYKGKKGIRVLRGANSSGAVYVKKGRVQEILKYVSVFFATTVILALGALVLFILINGIGAIDWHFLFGQSTHDNPTLGPAILSTVYVILFSLAIALPIGIGAAIYLVEYAKPGSRAVKILRTFIDTLAGVPSIVFGLFGMIFFTEVLGLGKSVFAGALTMSLIILPTVIRSTEESLLAVPRSLREASYGLGAGKVRTIFKVVLPSAFPGIATAIVLSIGRIVGESAALIYTAGCITVSSGNPFDMGSTLSVLMYYLANEGLFVDKAYATAVVLLVITFALNLIVYFIEKRVRKRR